MANCQKAPSAVGRSRSGRGLRSISVCVLAIFLGGMAGCGRKGSGGSSPESAADDSAVGGDIPSGEKLDSAAQSQTQQQALGYGTPKKSKSTGPVTQPVDGGGPTQETGGSGSEGASLSPFSAAVDLSLADSASGDSARTVQESGGIFLRPADGTDDSTDSAPGDNDFTDYADKTANILVAGGRIVLDTTQTVLAPSLAADWTPKWDSLIAHWTFDNTGTDAVGGHSGTAIGTPTFGVDGKSGSHYAALDGSSQGFSVAPSAGLSMGGKDLSVAFWLRIQTANSGSLNDRMIIEHNVWGGTGTWQVATVNGTTIRMGWPGSTRDMTVPRSFANGQWHHVAVTFDKTTMDLQLFFDGELADTDTATAAIGVDSAGTYIGHRGNATHSNFFPGDLDDLGIWTAVLAANDVRALFLRQKPNFSGSFTSRVVDGFQAETPWSGLDFVTSHPFGKELSPQTESGYPSASSDLSANNGLVGYWPLDGLLDTTAANGTSITARHGDNGTIVDSGGSIPKYVLGRTAAALALDGSNDSVTIPATGLPSGSAARTLSVWINSKSEVGRVIAFWGTASSKQGNGLYYVSPTSIRYYAWASDCDATGLDLKYGDWQHVVATFDGASTQKIYVNGRLAQTCNLAGWNTSSGSNLRIGWDGVNSRFYGAIDDVAIWSRALSNSEVGELYRRSVSRVKLQIRTCDDATCSSSPEWVGSDGSNQSFLSELHNTVTGIPSGAVLSGTASLSWDTLLGGYTDFGSWLGAGTPVNRNKRYVQYRAILETDDSPSAPLCDSSQSIALDGSGLPAGDRPCGPDLVSVTLAGQRYDNSGISVVTYGAGGIPYGVLDAIAATDEACAAGVLFEFADGGPALSVGDSTGLSWLTFHGNEWVASTGVAGGQPAMTAGDLLALTPAQLAAFPRGAGNLYMKAYLRSTGSTSCGLGGLSVSGRR